MKKFENSKLLTHTIVFSFFILFVTSCEKKKNVSLAQTYYKMSMLELSETDISEHNYKRALLNIEKALKQNVKPEFLALKATLLFNLGHYDESEQSFKDAMNETKEDHVKAEILNNYACLLAQKKQPEKALKIWQDLEHSKDYLTPEVAYVNEGKFWYDQQNHLKAKECFQRATNLAPEYLDAHYYLSLAAYQLKDTPTAKNEIKTVLFLEPEHKEAQKLSQSINKQHKNNKTQS